MEHCDVLSSAMSVPSEAALHLKNVVPSCAAKSWPVVLDCQYALFWKVICLLLLIASMSCYAHVRKVISVTCILDFGDPRTMGCLAS